MAWTDLSAAFAYGSKLTSTQMQNLRDNVEHLYQLGKNQLFAEEYGLQEKSSGSTSYSIGKKYRIYIPADAESLRVTIYHKVDNGSGISTVKAVVEDDEASTAESSEETTSETTYQLETLTVDCSGLSDGPAELQIQNKINNVSYNSLIIGCAAIWNK